MGLANIDPIVRKSTPRFTKSPLKFGVNWAGLILTEIQAFKNVDNLQRNV